MRHLALSISFKREVSANFSPILLFDFATVFVYVYGTRRYADGYLEESGLREEPN